MTTVIVVVVVALVFFVTLCTVTFMVWKREEEMRTDSLRSIESNLQELGYRMSGDFSRSNRSRRLPFDEGREQVVPYGGSVNAADPFEWTRETGDVQHPVEDEETLQPIDEHVKQDVDVVQNSQSAPSSVGESQHESVADIENISDFEDLSGIQDSPDIENAPTIELPIDELAFDDETQLDDQLELDSELDLEDELAFNDEINLDHIQVESDFADLAELAELEIADDFVPVEDELSHLEEDVHEEEDNYPEIQLDQVDIDDDIDGYVADYIADDMIATPGPSGNDIGRSGKKYTAEELDMLIKE